MTKDELKRLKVATEKLTKWETSGKAFGHYQILEAKATDVKMAKNKGADSLYEFWCLMKILDDLRVNYNITCVAGSRADKKVFPQAPAPKKGFAYFNAEDKAAPSNKFQICYGTEIKLSLAPKTTIAPDISFQKHDATDDPDETMVELIMDARFKYNNTAKLSVDQIHGFIQRVNALKTQNAASIALRFHLLPKLGANCLLTNGQGLNNQDVYCSLNHVKQVEKFDLKSSFNVIG